MKLRQAPMIFFGKVYGIYRIRDKIYRGQIHWKAKSLRTATKYKYKNEKGEKKNIQPNTFSI